MKMTVGIVLFSLATILVRTTAADGHRPGCYNLHAVFTFNDTQYFIFGNHWMVGFDFNGDIVYKGHVHDTGFNHPVTAAVSSREENIFYLISGIHEHGFYDFFDGANFLPLYWSGVEGELLMDPHFKGIDAAFEWPNSTVFYFSGCDFTVIDIYNFNYLGKGHMHALNLPCHVDAAWSSPKQQVAYITKGLKLWTWHLVDATAEGPYHLFSLFCPLSTFLCPA